MNYRFTFFLNSWIRTHGSIKVDNEPKNLHIFYIRNYRISLKSTWELGIWVDKDKLTNLFFQMNLMLWSIDGDAKNNWWRKLKPYGKFNFSTKKSCKLEIDMDILFRWESLLDTRLYRVFQEWWLKEIWGIGIPSCVYLCQSGRVPLY